VIAMVNWTPVLVALAAGLPGIVASIVSLGNRRKLTTHNGRTIGEQVEQANVASAATLVHTTQLVSEVAAPVPPLVEAAKEGLREVAAIVPAVISESAPKASPP
jgi:hypothetical protein